MYEARAKDCLAEAQWNARAGHVVAAEIFQRGYEKDMHAARQTLAKALRNRPEVAA